MFCVVIVLGALAYILVQVRKIRLEKRRRITLLEFRRIVLAILLILLMSGIFAGSYLINAQAYPSTFVFSWAACMLLVFLVVVIAFWDLAEVQRAQRLDNLKKKCGLEDKNQNNPLSKQQDRP
ncbi:hypothetical protein ACFLU6_10540 [Acidobacteriota bacterium]